MNPGNKVRIIQKGSYYGVIGTFENWTKKTLYSEPYCVVRFKKKYSRGRSDSYVMAFAPWDLEFVAEESGTCDDPITTGRRFQQEHTCTLPAHHNGGHLCNVCGHQWEEDTPSLKLIPKYAATYDSPYFLDNDLVDQLTRRKMDQVEKDKEVPNEGS